MYRRLDVDGNGLELRSSDNLVASWSTVGMYNWNDVHFIISVLTLVTIIHYVRMRYVWGPVGVLRFVLVFGATLLSAVVRDSVIQI